MQKTKIGSTDYACNVNEVYPVGLASTEVTAMLEIRLCSV